MPKFHIVTFQVFAVLLCKTFVFLMRATSVLPFLYGVHGIGDQFD